MKKTVITFLLVIMFSTASFAEGYSKNRFGLDFKISYRNQSSETNTTISQIKIGVDVQGIAGKATLNYYIKEQYSFFISAGLLFADTKSVINFSDIGTETNLLIPVHFGTKYYFIPLDDDSALKPHITGAVGPTFGFRQQSTILKVESKTEAVLSAYLGAGADLHFSNSFKFIFDVGYNLVGDFSDSLGEGKNYSGTELSFGLGFIF